MARAAVRAKQAQQAQARAAVKPSRKRGRHASGGNPTQDLFFVRLRRRQRWVFLGLAVVFAVSFTLLGVGSGTGGGLTQLWNGIWGGSDAIGQAQAEIKTNPAKGYRDLANAYVAKGDLASAIIALNLYLKTAQTDSEAWTLLGSYNKQQGDTYASQYQQVVQASQLQAPGTIFQPTGTGSTQLGTNPIEQYYSQQASTLSQPLYQKAIDAYDSSLTDYENAAKYAKGASNRAAAELAVYSAAHLTGNAKVELQALQRYVQLSPNATNLAQIEAACKSLGGSCTPQHAKKK